MTSEEVRIPSGARPAGAWGACAPRGQPADTSGRRRQLGPLGWCLAAALLFGASTPAAKSLVPALGPVLLSGLLYAGAALAVLPAAFAQSAASRRATQRLAREWGPTACGQGRSRRHHPTSAANDRWRLLGAVLCGGIIGPVLLLWGLLLAPAGSVSLWLTLETVATAVLARLLFQEHLGYRGWLAVALVVIATAVLSGHLHLGRAALLVGIACVAWGLDNNLTSLIDGYTPAQTTLVKGAAAGLVAIPIGWLLGGHASLLQTLAALGIGALGYGLSLVLYVAGAQQLGATRSQLLFSTAPLFGLGLAWVALGESVGWSHGLAATLMAAAIWLLRNEHHEHKHQHEPMQHTHWHRHDDGHHSHPHPEPASTRTWHQHHHRHEGQVHRHPHRPDMHHRHPHD
jgi:drug/metabolite transporter (DMT)-like permease